MAMEILIQPTIMSSTVRSVHTVQAAHMTAIRPWRLRERWTQSWFVSSPLLLVGKNLYRISHSRGTVL